MGCYLGSGHRENPTCILAGQTRIVQLVHFAAMTLSSSLCPILRRSEPQLPIRKGSQKRICVHFPHVTTTTTLPSVILKGGVWGGWGVRLTYPGPLVE